MADQHQQNQPHVIEAFTSVKYPFVSARGIGNSLHGLDVTIYEIDGIARAHPDQQVLRPHVAGGAPVNDKEVVMTYCGLTNLGMAYVPEIDGEKLDLYP